MKQSKIKQLVWDYKISPSKFIKILKDKDSSEWPNQDWAIIRVLEHMNYYDATSLVPLDLLARRWKFIKPKVFSKAIKDGYEFVLRRHALSTAG